METEGNLTGWSKQQKKDICNAKDTYSPGRSSDLWGTSVVFGGEEASGNRRVCVYIVRLAQASSGS